MTSAADEVLVSVLADGVRTLTLNRPHRRNALNGALIEALIEAFHEARHCPDTRVVVLTGAGDAAFCSGADLDPAAAAQGPIALHDMRRRYVDLLRAIKASGRPVVAKVHAPCMAGGIGLLASCDLAVASTRATFTLPELKVGLFPMMVMAVLRRTLARRHVLELAMTADAISAERAAEIGLVNRAVAPEDLDEAVHTLAARLASFSPLVMRLGREAFYSMEDMPLDNALDFLCDRLSVNALAEDAAEGLTAFITRRAPEWKGR